MKYNRICSDNEKFDQHCNDLEKWLIESGYSEKLVRTQILKTRGESRVSLLDRGNTSESKLTFNITYCPAFQNVRRMHIVRTSNFAPPDKEHKMVFTEVPIVGFRNSKSIKDYLVRAALSKIDNTEGPEACKKVTCQVCDHIITTKTFTTKTYGEVFKIPSGPLNCNLEKLPYLLRCKIFDDTSYVGKTKTKFHLWFNNYKSKHRSFRKGKQNELQNSFHSYYVQDCHKGIDYWEFTLLEKCEKYKYLKERETFW